MSASNLDPYTNPSGLPVTHINCVYAISGTYGLLPRLLYYATLVLSIFGRRSEWLIIGALVSALTYAGTAAIHAMVLTASKRNVFDLDIIAIWAILSTGALAYIGIIHWSTTMRESRARVVMICWGFLVGMGLIFGRAELFDTVLSLPEPACFSSKGALLETRMQLIDPDFNCTYQCFDVSKPMRQKSEIIAVPHRNLDNSRYKTLTYILVGPIQFAAYAALSVDAQYHTPSVLCVRLVMGYLIRPEQRDDFTKAIYKAGMQSWYGGYFVLFAYIRRIKWNFKKASFCFIIFPWLLMGLAVDLLCLPLMVINIVLNEITLLQGGYPTNEANIAIGQWGPIVNSLLVLIAALINQAVVIWERRRNAKKLANVVDRVVVGNSDIEMSVSMSDTGGAQEIGVVKPKLVHVQTLQEMDVLVRR